MADIVAAVIFKKRSNGEKEYLFMSTRHDYGEKTGFLQPTAGHIEDGETEERALRREVMEELNVGITSARKLSDFPGDVPNHVVHWWECELESHNFNLQLDEISEIYWLTRDELINRDSVWPATKKFFQEVLTD